LEASESVGASGGVALKAASLLLLYCCFTAALLLLYCFREARESDRASGCVAQKAATLLLLYYCVTAALLLMPLREVCLGGGTGFFLLFFTVTAPCKSFSDLEYHSPKNKKGKSSFSSESILSDAKRIFSDFFLGKTDTPRSLLIFFETTVL
jgi:hypothetical protein